MQNISYYKKGSAAKLLMGLIVGFVILIVLVTRWINANFHAVEREKPVVVSQEVPLEEVKVHKNLIRKTMLDPNREFAQSIIYDGEKEIARYKSVGEKIYDMEGEIPDGKVEFVDASSSTYGFEFYEDSKRHGTYQEFYNGGALKKEMKYFYGVINSVKEYFFDGSVRMEADYSDGFSLADNRETGKGKVYYRKGSIMYEWNLTNSDENRYKKSYNIAGELVETKLFDKNGVLIKTESISPPKLAE
jgi:antitoxin component YwqK of YwqJK toxin-antitoxin module